jgi:hypothetical protein
LENSKQKNRVGGILTIPTLRLKPKKPVKPLKTRDASHCDLAIYSKKYLKAKEELYMEIQIFQHAKI